MRCLSEHPTPPFHTEAPAVQYPAPSIPSCGEEERSSVLARMVEVRSGMATILVLEAMLAPEGSTVNVPLWSLKS